MKKKTLRRLLALFFAMLMLAGCAQANGEIIEEPSETGTTEFDPYNDGEAVKYPDGRETANWEDEVTVEQTVSEHLGLTALAVVPSYVNVRTGPSTQYDVVGRIDNYCAAEILDETPGEGGNWYLMTSGNCTGYVKSEFFLVGEEAEALRGKVGTIRGTVITDNLRIRASKDLNDPNNIIDKYSIGTVVIIDEITSDGWAKVSPDESAVGYVHTSGLEIETVFLTAVTLEEQAEKERLEAEAAEAAKKAYAEYLARIEEIKRAEAQAKWEAAQKAQAEANRKAALRNAIVAYALQFKGRPYVHAGRSLITGTDCSGFTALVYKNFGYKLSFAPEVQWKQGTQVPMDLKQLLPGDLIFFTSTTKYYGHVGIYIGNGKLIHAANEQLGVIISDAFYRQPVCVIRIVN